MSVHNQVGAGCSYRPGRSIHCLFRSLEGPINRNLSQWRVDPSITYEDVIRMPGTRRLRRTPYNRLKDGRQSYLKTALRWRLARRVQQQAVSTLFLLMWL